jgi:hypothetical protein
VRSQLSQRPASLRAQAHRIASVTTTLRRVGDDLRSLRPPQGVESENEGLVHGARALATEIKPLTELAAARDARLPKRTAAVLRTSWGLDEIEQAANQLEQHGYDVGSLPQ